MRRRFDWTLASAAVITAAAMGLSTWTWAADRGVPAQERPVAAPTGKGVKAADKAGDATPVEKAKELPPLSETVQKGLKWLIEHQNKDGGWGQGEESTQMGNAMASVRDVSNVGDTCAAGLALLRSGSTPSKGDYANNLLKAAEYVCSEVEKADEKSLTVTSVQGTRLQGKLGTYIDTFLASYFLGEIRNQMPDPKTKARIIAALDKVLNKIEKNQKEDGSFANAGWAPSLAQGIVSSGTSVAVANGGKMSEDAVKKLETYQQGQQDKAGNAKVDGSSAGISLYAYSANVGSMRKAQDRLDQQKEELKAVAAAPATAPAAKAAAIQKLREIEQRAADNGEALKAAEQAVATKITDEKFVAGFGNNGGEEYLSYLNIGEALFAKGGDDWKKWKDKIVTNLENTQNKDGSWSGHHCITGRTFCTSAALMVQTIERAHTTLGTRIKKS